MSEMSPRTGVRPKEVVIATLNVNGLPTFRQNVRTKSLLLPYQVRHLELCRRIESSNIDVMNLQEVFTQRDLRLFRAHLPSFGFVSFEPSLLGPKGALVTFSRLPMERVGYDSYYETTKLADTPGLSRMSLIKSGMKGILVSRLTTVPVTVINTHPLANDDWDWSEGNRFQPLQEAQLNKLASVVTSTLDTSKDAIVLGCDLNVAKDSDIFRKFLGRSGLKDILHNDASPTFHAEFLEPEQRAQCIDFLLTSHGVGASSQRRIFEGRTGVEGYGHIYLTDHQGLSATLSV